MQSAERQAFLDATLSEQVRAERALHNGDVTPRLSTWSHHDPVTCFGAAVPLRSGWTEVRSVFDWLAETFVSCDEYDYELVAADADMAPPSHAVELFALLDGGQRDGGWMGEGRPKGGHALAILPGLTHYNIFTSPLLAQTVLAFVEA